MKAVVTPSYLYGSVTAPPSKSHTQRLLAAALLHKGKTVIGGHGASADEQVALRLIQQLGATVISGDRLEILSNGVHPVSRSLNMGESGLATRLFTPIAALASDELGITGEGSLLRRPMPGFKDVLPLLGVKISGFDGYLPMNITGPLNPRFVKLDAGDGSQFLSGLLMAMSAIASEPLIISVTNLKSKPYIDLTLEVLAHFGKPILHENYRKFFINPALFTKRETIMANVETDWSSAAFLLVAGAIAGDVTVRNLNLTSVQADRAIVKVLQSAGASLKIDGDEISIKKSQLRSFDFDATDAPDLFPILAVLAGCCYGDSSIMGVHRLFYKESNRVESVTEMLMDFAIPFSIEDDTLYITGNQRLQGTIIDSYRDHRIVMAAAIGALRANGPVEISGCEAVNKSFPGFFETIVQCGASCEIIRK